MQLTPTQQRILKVLRDGEPHSPEELMACFPDELVTRDNLNNHLSRLRGMVKPLGLDILCVWVRRQRLYRLVRLIEPIKQGVSGSSLPPGPI